MFHEWSIDEWNIDDTDCRLCDIYTAHLLIAIGINNGKSHVCYLLRFFEVKL